MITSGLCSVHVGSSVGAGVRLQVIREMHTEARSQTHHLPEEPTTQRHRMEIKVNFGPRDCAEPLV